MSSLIDYCSEQEEERREAARNKLKGVPIATIARDEKSDLRKGMVMPVIKFSSNYPKLHNQTSARLLYVERIRIDQNTPPELLEYDTTKADGSRYPLPTGIYLQLVFLGNFRIPFCTIRRSGLSLKKEADYISKIGRIFEIEVKND